MHLYHSTDSKTTAAVRACGIFQQLPPEILLLIFRHFDQKRDRQDLLSLCHVCRAFRQLAQPILFSEFDVDMGPGELYANNFMPLALFTRTVLSRVDIRKATRRVFVRGQDDPMISEGGRDTSSLTTDTLTFLVDEIKKLDPRCSTDIRSGEINPILAVLVANLERLETLRISYVTDYMTSLLDMFDTGMAQSYFSKLISIDLELVCVDADPAMEVIYSDRILPLLTLPRLQQFWVNRCLGDSAYHSEEGIPPKTMNFSSISLVHSCLDCMTLTEIILASKRLKVFTYSVSVDIIENLENTDPINTEELIEALSCHAETLNEAHISMKERSRARAESVERPTTFESFLPLRNLRYLDIEQAAIIDAPELPESLKMLRIKTCNRPIFELAEFLVKESRGRLCSLVAVKVAPRSRPCTGMLGMEESAFTEESLLDGRVFTEEPSKLADFREQVQRLETIVHGANFNLYVACASYMFMSKRRDILRAYSGPFLT